MRTGLFNFYLSCVYVVTHLEASLACEESRLRALLSLLLTALVNNGMFTHVEFLEFKKFVAGELVHATGIEHAYYRNAIESVTRGAMVESPLKLSSLCRIKVRSRLVTFSGEMLAGLGLSKNIESFLMFDKELKELKNLNI